MVMTETMVTPEPMLSLIVDPTPHGHANATVPVRWCISEAAREAILGRNIEDPYVVLVVENGGKELNRVVRPLTDMMAYVQVPRAGRSTIHGAIVFQRTDTKEARKRLGNPRRVSLLDWEVIGERELSQKIDELYQKMEALEDDAEEGADVYSHPDYIAYDSERDKLVAEREALIAKGVKRTVLGFSEIEYRARMLGESDAFDVDIPDFLFARRRPWLDRYSRIMPWWHGTEDRDECSRRNRVLWTALLTPLYAVALLLIKPFFLLWALFLAVFLGYRDVNWKPVVQLDNWSIGAIGRDLNSSFWLTKRVPDSEKLSGYRDEGRGLVALLNPPLLAIMTFVVFVAIKGGMVTLYVLGILAILALIGYALSRVVPGFADRREARREREFHEELGLMVRDASEVGCAEANLDALPLQRRTVYLRFCDLKARVCKPMQK